MSTTKRDRKFIRTRSERKLEDRAYTTKLQRVAWDGPPLQEALDDWAEDYEGSQDLFI